MSTEIKEKITAVIKEIKPYKEFSYASDLFESKVLDSLSFAVLITSLEEEFDVEFEENDILTEYFKSVNTIADLIVRVCHE